MSAAIDLKRVARFAIPVKGVAYHTPLRFLEIYGNSGVGPSTVCSGVKHSSCSTSPAARPWSQIARDFLPKIPGVRIALGDDVPQPPFAWRDADADYLALSFTYNTNALFRILSLLSERRLIEASDVDLLLDRACLLLASLYKARNHFLIRNINNNLNMYLISKVVESLVGKKCYNSDQQELQATRHSLTVALSMATQYKYFPVMEKMAVALGEGVCFMESRMSRGRLSKGGSTHVQEAIHQFYGKRIAIDHRSKLLEVISNAGLKKNSFSLAVILDDATESVGDLLWLQDLMQEFPFFKAHLLVNTAQVSINFSSHMMREIWRSPCFRSLVSRIGSQLFVTRIYCPLISFQTNYLPPSARKVIRESDAVYVKGANFFETCQIPEKDSFHAFVVFGPMCRAFTGLSDFQGVFSFLPAGTTGYRHHAGSRRVVSLSDTIGCDGPSLWPTSRSPSTNQG
jgi:hypothetical protein